MSVFIARLSTVPLSLSENITELLGRTHSFTINLSLRDDSLLQAAH